MDDYLRNKERLFRSQPTQESLCELLVVYARSLKIPEADLRILALCDGVEIPDLSRAQLGGLYDSGYQAGIYLVTENPAVNTSSVIGALLGILKEANKANVSMLDSLGRIGEITTVDNIDIRLGNNIQRVMQALTLTETDWQNIAQTMTEYYFKENSCGLIFIPAWVIEHCYSLPLNLNRNRKSSTTIDWQSKKIITIKEELLAKREPLLGSIQNFYGNLFLTLDRGNVRTKPLDRLLKTVFQNR